MDGITASPPQSIPSSPSFIANRTSRSSSSSSRPALTLDLSNLPPLSHPSPPSNTLLITDLQDMVLFQPASLATISTEIESVAPLNSFSPLPSLRRIVCSFHSVEEAIRIRKLLDGQSLLGRNVRTKIYFGEPTPILDEEEARRPKFLEAPQLDKLFFISPPPSPPHGWVVRNEEPPNKEVHASDLAHALATLNTSDASPDTPMSMSSEKRAGSWPTTTSQSRSRSSTIIYNPEDHGGSPNLPAVMVEDMSAPLDDADVEMSPIEMSVNKLPPKTSRPPVEFMV